MEFGDFPFGKDDNDKRLDKIIRRFLPECSLSEVYSLIRKGLIRINRTKTTQNYRISDGDILNIAAFILEKKGGIQPAQQKTGKNSTVSVIEGLIVFKNEHLLVLNKPYDIKVHGDDSSLDVMVKAWYEANIKNDSLSFRPGPLHRLDRKTTGLLVFSLSTEGARWFTENIENHVIRKSYIGIMEGHFTGTEKWTDKIEKNDTNPNNGKKTFHTVKTGSELGKTAVTRAFSLKTGEFSHIKITKARFDIETGRTHQIRAQSSLHGFPLLGDTAYGSEKISMKRDFYLHAWKLSFPKDNPLGLPEELVCEPDSDFLFV